MMKLQYQSKSAYKARMYPFDADQISKWRKDGKSWPWIAQRYGCNHTSVMYAAVRMGCYLGKQRKPQQEEPSKRTPEQWMVPIGAWPDGISFK